MPSRAFFTTALCGAALMSAGCLANRGDGGGGSYVYTNQDGQRVECTHEAPRDANGHPILGTLAGGAIGGLVGNQFGKGQGKTAATAAGAVAGGAIGHHVASGTNGQQPEDYCHIVGSNQ